MLSARREEELMQLRESVKKQYDHLSWGWTQSGVVGKMNTRWRKRLFGIMVQIDRRVLARRVG